MFINLSNHPLAGWGTAQRKAAERYGQTVDLPFPAVEPAYSGQRVQELAREYADKVYALAAEHGAPLADVTAMVSGEFSLTYHLVTLLKEHGVHCVCACTQREAVETRQPDGSIVKTARFAFVQFRDY